MQNDAARRAFLLSAAVHWVCRHAAAVVEPGVDESCLAGGSSCQYSIREGRRHGLLQIGHNLLPRVSESLEDPFASLDDEFDLTKRQAAVIESTWQNSLPPKLPDRQFYVAVCQDLVIFVALIVGVKLLRRKAAEHAAELEPLQLEVRYQQNLEECENANEERNADTATPSTTDSSPGTDAWEVASRRSVDDVGSTVAMIEISSECREVDTIEKQAKLDEDDIREASQRDFERAEPEPEER